MKKTILLNLIVLLVTAASGSAATRLVPDEYATIQAAIDACVDGDVVIVAEGIYFENINFKGRNIILRGTDPNNPNVVAATIIDGGQNGSVATFSSGEDANCVLNGFTLTNGCGSEEQFGSYTLPFGGAIYCAGSGPTITNCIITGNKATYGAGIFAGRNGNPTITNCTIIGNNRPGIGGGYTGGGIYCWWNSAATITDCTISGNHGAGIYFHGTESPSAEISNCEITDNSCVGISFRDGTINNCTISNNGNAGILCSVWGMGAATISNCIISGNQGLGIRSGGDDDSIVTITNCTITGNHGKGFSSGSGETIITNSIVWGNTGEDIYLWNFPPLPNGHVPGVPSKLTVSYSCPGIIFVEEDPIRGDPILILGDGNIDANPLFADAASGDYHLLPDSPCIDAGTDAGVYTDIEGNIRPFDFPGVNNNGELPDFDMGAYEAIVLLTPYELAVMSIKDATAKKVEALERIGAALEKEWAAYEALEEWLESGDYGDLNRGDIIKAKQKIRSAIQHQAQSIDALEKSIEKLEDGLSALGYEPKPPSVNITKPQDGAMFRPSETIEIEANVWDVDGTVVKVEFFANGSKIGEDNCGADGWKTNWYDHPAGTYSLTAKATDDDGAATTSPAVGITVVESPPTPGP
jgi:hypothetical protein